MPLALLLRVFIVCIESKNKAIRRLIFKDKIIPTVPIFKLLAKNIDNGIYNIHCNSETTDIILVLEIPERKVVKIVKHVFIITKNANCKDNEEEIIISSPTQILKMTGDITQIPNTKTENKSHVLISAFIERIIHKLSFLLFASVKADQNGVIIIEKIT